jgi:hypothetical protein
VKDGGLLHGIDPDGVLLVGLLSAHVISDFLVQTEYVAAEKEKSRRVLLRHAIATFATSAIILIPCWNTKLLIGLLILSVAHLLLDGGKSVLDERRRMPLTTFFLDQGLHVISIVLAWWIMVNAGVLREPLFAIPDEWMERGAKMAVMIAGLVFNGKGGTAIVRRLLDSTHQVIPGAKGQESRRYTMGRTIGNLERFLAYALVLLGQWGALGLILAAKSIARFRELENQDFADYYLIGTLTSLSVAVATGVLVGFLIH